VKLYVEIFDPEVYGCINLRFERGSKIVFSCFTNHDNHKQALDKINELLKRLSDVDIEYVNLNEVA